MTTTSTPTTADILYPALPTAATIISSTTTTTAQPSTAATTPTILISARTTATLTKTIAGSSHGHNKRPTIIVYPTVSPESVVIPIVSCILGFPILALLVICCLRRRAKMARERDRRRNYDLQDVAGISLVRFSPIHRLTNRSTRAVSLRSERSMSRVISLELDTVLEERSDNDLEQTQTDLMTPDSPCENNKFSDYSTS